MQQTFWIIEPPYPNFYIILMKVDFKITVSFVLKSLFFFNIMVKFTLILILTPSIFQKTVQ